MNVKEYYKHCRSLGNFRAIDCIEMARQAANMDEKASKKPTQHMPSLVHYEVTRGNETATTLSFSIYAF